ncbi:MAG: OB-fold putative lipoprotein [Bacteroidetes bacterium]|nr:OB-fold putative lipoprotein [Bacteroidota bacterium]
MKKWQKIILVLFLAGVLGGLYGYFFVYNKPHPDYADLKAEHILPAAELFDAYRTDKSSADALYTGKMVEINGTLNRLEQIDSLRIVVFVFDQGMFGEEGIRCTLLPEYVSDANSLAPGDLTTIKGLCTGYNETDVILEKSVVVK